MPAHRLIRSLSSVPAASSSSRGASTSSRPTSSLKPPYAHSAPPSPGSSPSLVPPYSHKVIQSPSSSSGESNTSSSSTFVPSHRFSIQPTPSGPAQPLVSAKLRKLLDTPQGREEIRQRWEQSILALEGLKASGSQVPQVSFVNLGQHLSEASTVKAMRDKGVLVVRDVVHDDETRAWAKSLAEALTARQGRFTFWDSSLLAARSHPSVLSANNQVFAALTGEAEEAYILAAAIRDGMGDARGSVASFENPWEVDQEVSLNYSTPLTSQLALTPSTSTSKLATTPSIHAAVYATLHQFFRPVRSLISFYHASEYLDPSNWTMIDPSTADASASATPSASSLGARGQAYYPHLVGLNSQVPVPQLEPGDMIFHHSSLPIINSATQTAEVEVESGRDQIFLPVSPLPKGSNKQYITKQREAFERGLPPPGVHANGLVELEKEGQAGDVPSAGGRRAMGFE